MVFIENQSYLIIYLLFLVIMIAVSIYVYKQRKDIDEMHGMMIGMTFGIIAGLITATLYLIPTGNFLYGVIIGSILGLLFGAPFGKLGGHLGIMEGIIAGPMGGMMGAMLGQMIRPFDIDIFIPFLTFIFIISMAGITYAVNCRVNCCMPEQNQKNKISNKFILVWAIILISFIIISILLPFSIQEATSTTGDLTVDNQLNLPPYLQELTKEERKEAEVKGSYQEVDVRITSSKYTPNTIIAKEKIPLKINFYADENAGCGREVVFPDFKIIKLIPGGGKGTIDINPDKKGTFKFRCSMDMIRGKLIVS